MTNQLPHGPTVKCFVTAEIIESAVPKNSRLCLGAEAIRGSVENARDVAVDIQTCRFTDRDKGYRYIYLTPRSLQAALIAFDDGIRPEPFAFTLRAAHVLRTLTGRAANKAGLSVEEYRRRKRKGTVAVKAHQRSKPQQPRLRRPKGAGARSTPIRVGGKAPPQLKRLRVFGLRQFATFGKKIATPADDSQRDEQE